MGILDAILGAQSGGAVQQLGQQFGLNEAQVSSALAALAPAVAAGLKQNMSNPQGLQGLVSALGAGQHQQYVEDPGVLASPATVTDGNGILGHIFGSKDVSRQVASRAAAQTGISDSVLKGMLPVVAAMVMGSMSKRMGASPASMAVGGGAGNANNLLGMLTPMLDAGGDGSIVDDIAGIIGKMSGR